VSATSFASTAFGRIGFARWSGSAQIGGQLLVYLAEDIVANTAYSFDFNISNPALGQNSPQVGIQGFFSDQESLIGKVWMDRDNTSVLPFFDSKIGDAMPLQIRTSSWILKRIGQSTPFPGALNTLTVTLSTNVPFFSLLNTSGSVGAPCSTNFADFGISRCDDSLIVRSCMRTVVTISGLAGAIVPNCSGSCSFPVLWDTPDAVSPCGWMWSANSKSLTFTVTNTLKENVSYIFSFNLTNPVAGQASPPISIKVSGMPIAAISMEKDVNDLAPLFVYSIQFNVKQIHQSNPYPYAINCITVLLQTNLKLSFETFFRMYSFAGMVPVDSAFTSNGASIQLSEPRCSCLTSQDAGLNNCSMPYFSATSCLSRNCELEAVSRAGWDTVRNGLILHVAKEVSANENVSFSFLLRNSGTPSSQLTIYIDSQVGGVSFPSVPMDGLLTFLSARFQVKNIGQSSPYPAARNHITVTLIMNVPVFAKAGSIVTISGLRGISMPSSEIEMLGLDQSGAQACWRPCKDLLASCSGFAANNPSGSGNVGFAYWTSDMLSISFKILIDIPRNDSIIFRFIVINPSRTQQSPSVSVAMITGAVTVPYVTMDSDQGIPVQTGFCGEGQNTTGACENTARVGDASVLKVRSGGFVFTDLCMVQTNKFLGAVNTITVTISTSVPISTGQSNSFYLSGLSGAEVSEGANVRYSVLDCESIFSNITWASAKWNSEQKTILFELKVDTNAFWKYIISFDVINPSIPQTSPVITMGVEGITFPTVQPCRDKLNPPLLVENPQLSASVCQSTALPGAINEITLKFYTNVPLSPGLKANIVVSGFVGLSLGCEEASCLVLTGKDANIFSDSSGLVGHGDWNANYLSLSVWIVNSTLEATQYDLKFTLKNPLVAQDGQAVTVDFFLGNTKYRSYVSYCQGIFYPAYVVENKVLYAGIYGSTNFPGALNQVTFTLKMELALDKAITITMTGLRGSATFDNLFLPLFCPTCCAENNVSSCQCPMNSRVCNASALGQNCAQENFNGSAQWNQLGGRLELTPSTILEAGTQYYFTTYLQNPLYNQEPSTVIVRFSLPSIAAKQVVQEDSAYQFPALVDSVGFLVLAAGQSSPYPCDINTVTVTLALNLPLGPGVIVVLSGYSSAKFSCDVRSGTVCRSKLSSTQNIFTPYVAWQANLPGTLNLTIGNESNLRAGCNYTVSFTFRNPSYGQESPALGLSAEVRNISVYPFLGNVNIARSSVRRSDGLKAPLKILAAEFIVRELGASNPNAGAVNIISVTLATNVRFRLDCYVSFTLSGLSASSGDVVQVAYPGPDSSDPFQWRSDSCPQGTRPFFSIFNPVQTNTCPVAFAGTAQGTSSWLAPVSRRRAYPCTVRDCLGETYGSQCWNSSAWDVDETLSSWLRGQRSYRSAVSSQHVRGALPQLGGESCDVRWNCSDFAYDLGQCAPPMLIPSDVLDAGAWNSSSGTLVLYVRNETCPNVNYTIQFQITNPKVFHQSTFVLSAGGLDGLAIPKTVLTGTWGSSFMTVPASFVTKSLGQSNPYPGASNLLTLTIATNVPITERMLYYITIIGLKGATRTSGELPIRDASSKGSNDHLNFRAHPTSKRGLGKWNNSYKQLTLLVATDLVPNVNYTISFELFNSVSGQAAPVILIGSSKYICAPNSRPAAAAIMLTVRHVDGHLLDNCFFEMKSLEDFTLRPGGIWSRRTVMLPSGKWSLNFSKSGYHGESLEIDVLLKNNQVEISSSALEGTSCDQSSMRSAYQSCYWDFRPYGLETFLVPIVPNAAWFILTWENMTVGLDLWLVAKDSSSVSPWINPNCSGSSIIEGGGVYKDCPLAIIQNSGSKIQVERNLSRSYNQVVLSLFDVPAGEYHIYINVESANQKFSGTERGRAYLPDGTSTSLYTSLLRSQDGFWWYGGYFIKGPGEGMSFRCLSRMW
jgi:hypothetical protein